VGKAKQNQESGIEGGEMKAILKKDEKKGFALEDVPVPEPGEDEVLVKVATAAICGSDMKIYAWDPWCRNVVKSLPFIPGHEGAGIVEAVGKGVKSVSKGDVVAGETHIPCGACWQCTNGRPHTCLHMGLFGHTVNGCFAEYFVLPEKAVRRLPPGFPLEKGCLLEPMGIPLRAVFDGEVKGDTVAVIGCGPIGQFAVGLSSLRGAETVVAVDLNEKRLDIAHTMGAPHVINPARIDVVQSILKLTRDNGAGVVIEASGSMDALRRALAYVRIGGRIYTIGHPGEPLSVDVSAQINLREVRIIGLFGRELWRTWDIAEDIVISRKLDTDPIVTHVFPLDAVEEAFRVAESGEGCKIVFSMEGGTS
jgi:threonine 3-dehydrogenase